MARWVDKVMPITAEQRKALLFQLKDWSDTDAHENHFERGEFWPVKALIEFMESNRNKPNQQEMIIQYLQTEDGLKLVRAINTYHASDKNKFSEIAKIILDYIGPDYANTQEGWLDFCREKNLSIEEAKEEKLSDLTEESPNLWKTKPHRHLIKLMMEMNYPVKHVGKCYGITSVFAASALLGKEGLREFNERMQVLAKIPLARLKAIAEKKKHEDDEKNRINNIEIKEEEKKSLAEYTRDEIENWIIENYTRSMAINIFAFFDSVAWHQGADFDREKILKYETFKNQDIVYYGEIVFPAGLDEEKANEEKSSVRKASVIEKIKTLRGLYSCETLITRLASIRKQLDKRYPVSIMIKGNNCTHDIGISYDHNKDVWVFMNANMLPVREIKDNQELANFIIKSIPSDQKGSDPDSVHFFSMCIYSKKDDVAPCTSMFESIEAITLDTGGPEKSFTKNKFLAGIVRNVLIDDDLAIIKYFLERGMDLNIQPDPNTSLLFFACVTACQRKFSGEIIKAILDAKANPNSSSEKGVTSLSLAVYHQNKEIIGLLLEAGAKTDCRDVNGYTPLCIAINYQNKEIVSMLLKAGANPDSCGVSNFAPLHLAIVSENKDIAVMLLDAGANPLKQTTEFGSPLEYAIKKNQIYIALKMLRKILNTPPLTPETLKELSQLKFAENVLKYKNLNDRIATLLEGSEDPRVNEIIYEIYQDCLGSANQSKLMAKLNDKISQIYSNSEMKHAEPSEEKTLSSTQEEKKVIAVHALQTHGTFPSNQSEAHKTPEENASEEAGKNTVARSGFTTPSSGSENSG